MKEIQMETIAKSQKPINWVWKKYIPEGVVTVLAAKGGVGKSGFALHLAGLLAEKKQNTLYVDFEQTTSHMSMRWKDWNFSRYKEHIYVPAEISLLGMYESVKPSFSEVKTMAKNISARLIVIDSMSSLYSSYDVKDRSGGVKLIEDCRDIANELKCGLLLLAHVNKDIIDSKNQDKNSMKLDSINGSGAISDMARSVIGMSFDKQQDSRIIYHLKHNFTERQPNITFKMTPTGLTDFNFGDVLTDPIYIPEHKGTKIGQHVEIMRKGLLDGIIVKKDLQKLVRKAGGSAVDATNAYKRLNEEGHIVS